MNKTLSLFLTEIIKHEKLKELVLSNLKTQQRIDISLNLFELHFGFEAQRLTIQYYVEDSSYPSICLGFDEYKAEYTEFKAINFLAF